jgi:hypothetical protein
LATTPDVARDLQRQIAAQGLDGAGIGIGGHSVFTITLANTLRQAGVGSGEKLRAQYNFVLNIIIKVEMAQELLSCLCPLALSASLSP